MRRSVFILLFLYSCTPDSQIKTSEGQPISLIIQGDKPIEHNKLLVIQSEIKDENGYNYLKTSQFEPLFIHFDSTIKAGVIQEILSHSNVGDSVIVKVTAGNLWKNTFEQPLPKELNDETLLEVRVKIIQQIEPQNFSLIINQLDSLQYFSQYLEEEKYLENYVKETCGNCQKLSSGIFLEGTVDSVIPSNLNEKVSILYAASRLDGTEIDRGTMTFRTNQKEVIEGVELCARLLNEGDSGQFYIPSRLAYRSRGNGILLPPFSSLIFAIKLVKREYVE